MNHNLIREARKKRQLTQEALAQALGVNRATVSKYEAGSISPTVRQLHKLSEVLGVSVSELVWEGEGPAPEPRYGIATPEGPQWVDRQTHDRQERVNALLEAFSRLNPEGQREAVRRLQELSELDRYRSATNPPL